MWKNTCPFHCCHCFAFCTLYTSIWWLHAYTWKDFCWPFYYVWVSNPGHLVVLSLLRLCSDIKAYSSHSSWWIIIMQKDMSLLHAIKTNLSVHCLLTQCSDLTGLCKWNARASESHKSSVYILYYVYLPYVIKQVPFSSWMKTFLVNQRKTDEVSDSDGAIQMDLFSYFEADVFSISQINYVIHLKSCRSVF